MNDPISETLTIIRNAQAVGHSTVSIPFSKLKFELIQILDKKKLIKNASQQGEGIKKSINITLLYNDKKNTDPKIKQLKRISKPGKREYVKAKDIKPIRGREGINIISTSYGLMTGKEAASKNLGGEMLCQILCQG